MGLIGGERPIRVDGDEKAKDSFLSDVLLFVSPERIGDRESCGEIGDGGVPGMTLCCPRIGFVPFAKRSRMRTNVRRDVKLPIELLRRMTGTSHDKKIADAILPPG